MGNILSFILDYPIKFKKINFLESDTIFLTNMVYRGDNMLVLEQKTEEECSVLLSREDLLTLQDLLWVIFESITRKSLVVRPLLLDQFEKMVRFIQNKITKRELTKYEEIKQFIKRLYNEEILDNLSKSTQGFVNQLKIFICDQLAKQCHTEKEDIDKLIESVV